MEREGRLISWTSSRSDLFPIGENRSLLTFSCLAQSVGYFLVNFPPVTDGENPDHSRSAIQFVNDTRVRSQYGGLGLALPQKDFI